MMKQNKLFKSIILLSALVLSSANVWAQATPYYTLDTSASGNAGTNNAYASEGSKEVNGITWYATGNMQMQPWRIGGKASSSSTTATLDVSRTVYTATAMGTAIESIKLYIGNVTVNSFTSVVLTVSSKSDFSSVTDEITKSSPSASSTLTFSPTSGTNWDSNLYYKFTINATLKGKSNQYVQFSKVEFFEYTGGSPTPSITANNVNIAYNATNGSIGYSLDNATGNVSASVTSGDWLTLGTPTSSAVPFTCSANTGHTPRTAQVTLSFTGASNKVVTVTQAAAPNHISDITAANTAYTVIGTVVATNSRGFVTGDGTGYVYTYLNAAPSQSINDKVKIAGTTGTYGQVIQFTSGASITTESSSAYDGTPAATVINAVPDYTNNLHLSTYLQFEGVLEESSSNYYITVGSGEIQISYPTASQSTALSALDGKNVRVKGYFSGINSSGYFTVMMESVEEVTNPTISVDSSLTVPNYVAGTADPEYETLVVNGSNLTADITLSLGNNSNFEMSADLDTWTNSLSITPSEGSVSNAEVAVRLKAGLSKDSYDGTLTLSSTGATDKTVSLSGSVTGQTYEIAQYTLPATAHGTITFSPESPIEEGTEVTLTAEAAAGYDFVTDSWVFYKESGNEIVEDKSITVTDGKITMPAYDLYVDATFTAKPTYAITCAANPLAGGTIGAQPSSAYEGQSVALTINPSEGYTLSSVVITKTSDGSATDITVTNNAFTMPGYAVTATATFLSNTFEGSFVKHSGSLVEGDYILVYDNQAMNNSISSSRLGIVDVENAISNNTITDPSRAIVWHIAQSSTSGYWTIYNAKVNKYVCGSESSASVSLVNSPVNNDVVNDAAIWKVSGTYDFRCKDNEGQSTARYLRNNNGQYGNYAAQNGGALTLYKLFIAPDPSAPVWSSLPVSNEATVGEEFEINLLEYVSGYPVPSISVKSTSADPLLYTLTEGVLPEGILHFTPNVAGSFTFAFTATNSEGTADSGTLTITATATEVSTPVLSVDAANVTTNSALVSWTACTNATLYTIEKSESLVNESFEGNAVPTDWTANSISFSSGGSDGSYCATFNSGSDYLITPPVTNPGTISFNYKRSSNSTAWSLDVLYATSANADSWESIGTVNDATTSWKTFSKTINVTGTIYIKFKDSRSDSGTHARYVDLIQVTGATTSTEVSGTSYTFKDLSAETTYAARVQVKDAETWSDLVSFTTEAETPTTKDITIASGAKYNGRYWTTFYDAENGYKLPAGAQAFKLDDNKLVLLGDSGVVIPKETPVVIVSDKTSLTLTETSATVTVGDNDLVGSSAAVTVTEGKVDGKIPHVLSIKGSPTAVIGFYKFTGSEIPAGKAYVLVSE